MEAPVVAAEEVAIFFHCPGQPVLFSSLGATARPFRVDLVLATLETPVLPAPSSTLATLLAAPEAGAGEGAGGAGAGAGAGGGGAARGGGGGGDAAGGGGDARGGGDEPASAAAAAAAAEGASGAASAASWAAPLNVGESLRRRLARPAE